MLKRLRFVLAWVLTVFMVLQPVLPTTMAQDVATPETTEVVEEQVPTEEPIVTETEVVKTPVWLGELLTPENLKQATCDLAPQLNLDSLIYDTRIAKIEYVDEWGNVLWDFTLDNAADQTVWLKVTFVENHVLDATSHYTWETRDEGVAAVVKIAFDAAPTDADCTTYLVLPEPVLEIDETGTAAPEVNISAIAEIDGVESVVVEGDVVAGDDVVVRVVFAHRFSLETENITDPEPNWTLEENGEAVYTLSVPADDSNGEAAASSPEAAPDVNLVTLPAPSVTGTEVGETPAVDTSALEAIEGVE